MATVHGTARSDLPAGANLFDRQPPCNLEAERNTIGSILLLPETCDDVSLILRPEDFYDEAHRMLFTQIRSLHENGKSVDLTLLVDRLKADGEFETIGGAAYLAEVAQSVPTAANAAYYAKIVRDKSLLRSMIHTGTEIVQEAYEQSVAGRELLNRAEEKIFGIRDQRGPGGEIAEINDVLMVPSSRSMRGWSTAVPPASPPDFPI